MTYRGRGPTWLLPSCAIVVGLVMTAGALVWAAWPARLDAGGDPEGMTAPRPVIASPAAASASPRPRTVGRPVALVIPALGVRTPVDPVDAPDGDLQLPDDPDRVGWWQDGAAPGGLVGTVLIAGHVDTAVSGPGALFWLDRLHPGDAVTVRTTSGDADYVVATVRRYPKAALPRTVAAPSGAPGLAIVTCGGPFDRHARSYLDNVVVDAIPG